MSRLVKLSDFSFFNAVLTPLFDILSVNALASTNRRFRLFLRDEAVWRVLHNRDHGYLQPHNYRQVIHDELLQIRRTFSMPANIATLQRTIGQAKRLLQLLQDCCHEDLPVLNRSTFSECLACD